VYRLAIVVYDGSHNALHVGEAACTNESGLDILDNGTCLKEVLLLVFTYASLAFYCATVLCALNSQFFLSIADSDLRVESNQVDYGQPHA
jgi:hypothetical protein